MSGARSYRPRAGRALRRNNSSEGAPGATRGDPAAALMGQGAPPRRSVGTRTVKLRVNTEGPGGRARLHRGLALALLGSPGAEVGSLRQHIIAVGAAPDHLERDHVVGIAMQIPTRRTQGSCVFDASKFMSLSRNVSVQSVLRRSHGE
jgi:hypothetical protein